MFGATTPGSHLVSVSQRVSYLASARDNGVNISCTSIQAERGDIIHFSQKRSIQLRILPVISVAYKLTDNFSILSVIIISLFLIILMTVILTMVLMKRRRHSKDVKPGLSVKDHNSHIIRCNRQADLYNPLNVSCIDLYQQVAADQQISKAWSHSNSNSSVCSSKVSNKDDSIGLESSSVSDTHSHDFPQAHPSQQLHGPYHLQSQQRKEQSNAQTQTSPHTLLNCQHRYTLKQELAVIK